MGLTLAIDFGSTFTKLVAVDLDKEELVGVAQSPSTVATDMTLALHDNIEKIRVKIGADKIEPEHVVACSSAAGGLRVVAAGLVKALTTKAAEEAALGAGAKLIKAYSYGLTADDVKEMEQIAPDLVLLTGGTDGGNKECLLQNAAILAESRLTPPIIIAGNKIVSGQAREILEKGDKYAIIVDNVLPELDNLNVEPTRTVMRETFMQRIIHAKGLDKARAFVGDIIMPTPTAVLRGASLLAEGAEGEKGLGELMVVDVGGATTDVDSVAHGNPSGTDAIYKGLPEPYMKRTVEGDLGIRYNADTILEKAGSENILNRMSLANKGVTERINLKEAVEHLSGNVDTVPASEEGYCVDTGLASAAVDMAMIRHCGRIEEAYFPTGKVRLQYGKDMTGIKCLVGTGGIFAYGQNPRQVLESGCYNAQQPESLRPRKPDLYIDQLYIFYAIGLLSEISPVAALRILKKNLNKL